MEQLNLEGISSAPTSCSKQDQPLSLFSLGLPKSSLPWGIPGFDTAQQMWWTEGKNHPPVNHPPAPGVLIKPMAQFPASFPSM